MSWLLVEDDGPIRRLTIDRPDKKNAIPFDGWSELRDRFAEFELSSQRVLVITGAGGEFCAGADLGNSSGSEPFSAADRHRRMKTVGEAAITLHRLTKPTIAAVDGLAVGAGMNLAIGCDVVLASERARFSEIFVKRGLVPDFGGTWLLPRLVGLQRAKELVLSGRIIGAQEAFQIGLVTEVVSAEDLMARAAELARTFAGGAPIAQMLAKRALDASLEASFADSVAHEAQNQTIAFATEDATEGISSFIEKRDPEWTGR